MGSVRKRSAQEMQGMSQKYYNGVSDRLTNSASSGSKAKLKAELVDHVNKTRKDAGKIVEVVKINSASRNTGGVTSGSKTVNKLYRPMGGGILGGLFGNKQR